MKPVLIGAAALVVLVVAALAYMYVPWPQTAECIAKQDGLNQRMAALNYCSEVEDCELHSLVCPFGCVVFSNKEADFAPLKAEADQYGSECGSFEACRNECQAESKLVDCIDSKCVFI